jgi:hypothetical protein
MLLSTLDKVSLIKLTYLAFNLHLLWDLHLLRTLHWIPFCLWIILEASLVSNQYLFQNVGFFQQSVWNIWENICSTYFVANKALSNQNLNCICKTNRIGTNSLSETATVSSDVHSRGYSPLLSIATRKYQLYCVLNYQSTSFIIFAPENFFSTASVNYSTFPL